MITLKRDEIKDIISVIPCIKTIPNKIAEAAQTNIRNDLEQQLKGCKIYKSQIPKLKEDILHQYYKSQIAYGEGVGIITAQSIGERQTQMTLNTFHSAGNSVATVVTGVPRFSELINTTKKQKCDSMTMILKKSYSSIEDIRKDIGSSLVSLLLKDLIQNYQMYEYKNKTCKLITINPNLTLSFYETPMIGWIDIYKFIYNFSMSSHPYFMIFNLDKQKMHQYQISLELICEKINKRYTDIITIPSPYAECSIAVFIHLDEFEKKEQDVLYINSNNKHVFYMEDIILDNLKQLNVCGIPNILSMYIQSINQKDKWMVETLGANFVQALKHPLFDPLQTVCNNMWEIYQVLGLEAARQFLIEEFNKVVSSDGTYINIRHILIMVDMMTYSGTLTSISRYGMDRNEVGPLAKATFEECMENFIKAGIYGEKESTYGVSASIMCGKIIQSGTGMVNLLFKQS